MSGHWTILACGDASRGDDGAALVVVDRLAGTGAGDVRIRRVGQLEVDHLIEALAGGPCVVVDAVRGIHPGHVVELPLGDLASGTSGAVMASTHALPPGETIRLAELLGADLDGGTFIGIGGRSFELGAAMSPEAMAGVDAAAAAIERLLLKPRTAARCV